MYATHKRKQIEWLTIFDKAWERPDGQKKVFANDGVCLSLQKFFQNLKSVCYVEHCRTRY